MNKNDGKQQALETLQKAEREQVRKCSEEIYAVLVKYNCKQIPQWLMTGARTQYGVLIVPLQSGEPMPPMVMSGGNKDNE